VIAAGDPGHQVLHLRFQGLTDFADLVQGDALLAEIHCGFDLQPWDPAGIFTTPSLLSHCCGSGSIQRRS